jgi:hypothetical protein
MRKSPLDDPPLRALDYPQRAHHQHGDLHEGQIMDHRPLLIEVDEQNRVVKLSEEPSGSSRSIE